MILQCVSQWKKRYGNVGNSWGVVGVVGSFSQVMASGTVLDARLMPLEGSAKLS